MPKVPPAERQPRRRPSVADGSGRAPERRPRPTGERPVANGGRRPESASPAPEAAPAAAVTAGEAGVAGAGPVGTTGSERLAPVRFRPGSKRRWPRRILITANVLVALVIIGVGSAYGYLNIQLGRITRTHVSDLAASGTDKPFTMLLVGSDSRNIPGGSQFNASDSVGGQRSDTIMVARVVPATKQITLMSLPRDLWLPIPGMGSNRINSAFNNGPNLLVQTIENMGIPVNHYAEVNFDTFRDIANAIGGVHVWFPTPARDQYSNLVVGAGCDLLNGNGALAFVRSRHYEYYEDGYWHDEAESDLARVQRQQWFLKRMADKAKDQYTNPIALDGIVSGITKNLTVDDKLSTNEIISLAQTFRGIGGGNIPTETLSTNEAEIEGNDVLTLNQPEASAQIAAFNALGTTPPKSSTKSSSSSSTTSPSSVAPPKDAPSPTAISVEVANGSGVTGQAATATSDIQGLGYMATTDSTTQASVGARNVIRYAPDSQPDAQLLASQLVGGATLVADPSLTPTTFNIELITGSGFAGVSHGASAAPSSTSSSSTPATTAPSGAATVSTYELPGTPPGVTPPASCKP